jgi:hypothetical protein
MVWSIKINNHQFISDLMNKYHTLHVSEAQIGYTTIKMLKINDKEKVFKKREAEIGRTVVQREPEAIIHKNVEKKQ